ncbi:MAG: hypothetical protein LBI38_05665 [Oscillospiraceae bacterium]|jgi:Cu+-exporting ATPase|nr:hypothetical protein [Oscillospiraceae bacterium]
MGDKYSIDDILSELDKKKSSKTESETPSPAGEGESLTEELARIEARRFGKYAKKPNKDLSVTQIIDAVSPQRKKPAVKQAETAVAKPRERDSAVAGKPRPVVEPEEEKDSVFKPVKPVKIQRFSVPAKASPTRENSYVPAKKPAPDTNVAEETDDVSKTRVIPEQTVKPAPNKNADLTNPRKKKPSAPRPALLPEEKARLQKKREAELLEKDLALEEPDELIDGINPYDVKKAEIPGAAVIADIKVTRDIGENTRKPALADADIKEYRPVSPKGRGKTGRIGETPFSGVKSQKDKLSNSALLEQLNKSLAKKRQSDINARKTLTVDTLSAVSVGGDYRGRTLPSRLNIDYANQIIEDSSVLPSSDLMFRQLEAKELEKKKKRKIRDFILEDIDDGYDDEYGEEEASDDFDSYDTSGQIWEDLDESHKGLKWRFVLLFILTAGLTFATFLYEAGSDSKLFRDIRDNTFNGETRTVATAFVCVNLVAGVAGMAVCSGVILRGLQNLFKGKADCDSICALPCVLLPVLAAVQLTDTEPLQRWKAHIYVCAAVFALFFNTLGKLLMIVRAKRNFRFISGDSAKYFAHIIEPDERGDAKSAGVFTKGILGELPAPVFLRKTEFLTDYLKNSYCTDLADLICRRLTPLGLGLAVLAGVLAFFLPVGGEEMRRNICWAATAGGALLSLLSPFSMMFLVNNPLLRASKTLSKSDSVVMGYKAAQRFSKANAAVIDAGLLFPAGSVKFLNVKRCQKPGTHNAVSIDESIVIAASLAIKTNSIMSYMFYDMISGDSELLYKIENCIYEVNMGITGWMGSKRVMLGNREQMKHHGVDVPNIKKERKHCPENGEVVYLASGGETVAMFFIEVVPNPAVKGCLKELERNGIALAVRTKDSLVTVNKLSDIFELNPEKIRILPFDLHRKFDDCSRYTSRGNSEIACNGTFTSFARALIAAKTLIRDMTVTSAAMLAELFLAGILGFVFILFAASNMLSAGTVIVYNLVWLAITLILQELRRY